MLSALLLYLAAPNQQWGKLPFAPAVAVWLAVAFLLAGVALLLGWAGPATAIFIAMTAMMTVWSVVPLAIAWWRGAPEEKK